MATKKQFTSFDELIQGSEVPLLVDFYAEWCGPCQMMASILEQVNAQMNHQIQVVKINTEKYPQLASQYQVAALPTLMLFKNGRLIDRVEGVMQPQQLVQRLKSFI